MLSTLIRIPTFIIIKFVEVINIFTSVPYYFKKSKQCPPIQNDILLVSASELASRIRKREISSKYVVETYIERIKVVNPIINAVVEERFELAITDAENVDKLLSTTNLTNAELENKYPLLGLPITVKESISVEGLSYTAGKFFPGGRKGERDAEVVKKVKDAGAIPLLVSNTPEICVNFETINKITGVTLNPYDTNRTPSGSSGGEGALLGAGASVIGLGSDLFGSVRIPACFCGVWAHKPTSYVVSVDGHFPNALDKKAIGEVFTIGPMCRYGSDLRLLLNTIIDTETQSMLKLKEQNSLKDVKIYYLDYITSKSILTHSINPEIITAIDKFNSYMTTTYGCTVEKLNIKKLDTCFETAIIKITDMEFDGVHKNGEAFVEMLRCLIGISKSSFQALLPGLAYGLKRRIPKSVIPSCNKLFSQVRDNISQTLGPNGILVMPVHPNVANIHGQCYGNFFDYAYTGIFNATGLPASSCPMGLNSKGLPIGIQIISSLNNDRLCLTIAEEIERAFGSWIPPKFSDKY